MSESGPLPNARPARARGRSRLVRSAALLALFGFATATGLRASPPPIAHLEPVTMTLAPRYFDGVSLDIVVFRAASITLKTDTLGAWTPDESPAGGLTAGIRLRHRQHREVTLCLYPFTGANPAVDRASWDAYTQATARQLGTETIADVSTAGRSPGIGSWPGRAAWFLVSASVNSPPYAEQHLVAAEGQHGLAVVLAGPQTEVVRCAEDLEFLLARMELTSTRE